MEMSADAVKEKVYQAFSDVPRPPHFTNYKHCDECAEHDETLRSHDPLTISYKELGNPGWDPMCFAEPEAFLYYFPALVRLALDGRGEETYLDQFLLHLLYEGAEGRVKHFSKEQREATLMTLCYIKEGIEDELAGWGELDRWILEGHLDEAIGLWQKLVENE